MRNLSPRDLKAYLDATDPPPLLLDVREPWEYQRVRLPDSRLLPMGQVPGALDGLDREREIVVICHHGIRSRQVAYFLESRGFQKVINLAGGIDAWARDVDTDMATY